MTLEMLEERCQRFIDLMRQASVAIDQQDAIILEAVSRSSEILLEQIERDWYLAMAGPEMATGGANWESWERLRLLMRTAMHQSADNQRKMCSWAQRNRPTLHPIRSNDHTTPRYPTLGLQGRDLQKATACAQVLGAFPEPEPGWAEIL